MSRNKNVDDLLVIINVPKLNKQLLIKALTHKSYANDKRLKYDNEKLEFFGDSLLNFLLTELLYHHYTDENEGSLAKFKTYMISEDVLSNVAQDIQLGNFLYLNKSEYITYGNLKSSILADALEALIAAIYIDNGIDVAREFVTRFFTSYIQEAKENIYIFDTKTQINQLVKDKKDIVYDTYLNDKNYSEYIQNNKRYISYLHINGMKYGPGYGKSKKYAEKQVAYIALVDLKKI